MNRDSRESTLTDRTDVPVLVVPPERTPYRTRKLVYLLKGKRSKCIHHAAHDIHCAVIIYIAME